MNFMVGMIINIFGVYVVGDVNLDNLMNILYVLFSGKWSVVFFYGMFVYFVINI